MKPTTEIETVRLSDYAWHHRIYLRLRLAWFALTIGSDTTLTFTECDRLVISDADSLPPPPHNARASAR